MPGKSTKFQTAIVKDENGNNNTVNIEEYLSNRKVVDIAATGGAIALVTDDGEMLVAGMKGDIPTVPEGDTIKHVSGGTRHFTLVTEKGRVYAWGQNYRNPCNIPDNLQEEGAVDTVFSSGFQNYAYKDGEFVGSWGLKGYAFGTDDMGRDVFNRLMNGGKMTMTIGAVAVIALATFLTPALPYLLAFAAGAMFYVVVEELIPEASSGQHSNLSTIGFAIGFVLMMVLDVVMG